MRNCSLTCSATHRSGCFGGEPGRAFLVVEGRKGEIGRSDVERLLRDGGFDIVGVTPGQAEIAVDAFRRFGRGHHRARLNIGDCFSYALAIATDHSLLFKGDDFIHTDIRPALPPAT